jgi:3-dehydroquinate synthetase
LPTEIPPEASKQDLFKSIAFDKKRQGEFIKFVLPLRPVGTVEVNSQIKVSDFEELLESST